LRAIHAKIVNARRYHLHKESGRIARENRLIVVGNVNAIKLTRTRHGQIRARRRLVDVPQSAPIQGQ
jgi:transposase